MKIIFTLLLVQGGCWNLILWFATVMYSDIFGVFLKIWKNYRKLILWWEDCILVLDMSNKNENNFYITSCPGGLLKLDIMVRNGNVFRYIWSFSDNLENYRKLILWWEDCILVIEMSNKNENNFYFTSCPGGLLKLDIMVRNGNVFRYIWSFSDNLENYRKLILWWEDCILVIEMSNKILCFLL